MSQTHSSYRIGDCMRVKAGTKDPDFGTAIGGWQGRISNIDTSGDGTLCVVSIQWDSVTLKNMPVAMIEECELVCESMIQREIK